MQQPNEKNSITINPRVVIAVLWIVWTLIMVLGIWYVISAMPHVAGAYT